MPAIEPVQPNKVYAYMNQFGRVMEASEFERMRNNPKTKWVIAAHWAEVTPLMALTHAGILSAA